MIKSPAADQARRDFLQQGIGATGARPFAQGLASGVATTSLAVSAAPEAPARPCSRSLALGTMSRSAAATQQVERTAGDPKHQ